MFEKLSGPTKKLDLIVNELNVLKKMNDVNAVLNAKALINTFDYSQNLPLHHYEFKTFSQWGDDGIIQYLIHTIDFSNKTFIEFGVEDYSESNTRFLLINDNWSGFIMDGSPVNMEKVRNSELYWKYQLKALDVFITKENVNNLLLQGGFDKEVGILSIDIDGNDYWIWQEINVINPVIVIVEYNSVFGSDRAITVPYSSDFKRDKTHFSNLYWGASIKAFCELANSKGYSFIGCNSNGNNGYFIRNDKIKNIPVCHLPNGFVESKWRDSRDERGQLSYLSGKERQNLIKGLPVYNVLTNQIEKF